MSATSYIFLDAVPDDEEFPGQNECILGDDSDADGDSWTKTVVRVVTPNALSTLLEVFSYYFVNAMVTISAVIFIAGARTMVITTKIKRTAVL